MDILNLIEQNDLVLAEASIVESLRRSGRVYIHPLLEHALLVYDKTGRDALYELYNGYVSIAHKGNIPILLSSPTWRANQERITGTGITADVNTDAVKFLIGVRAEWGPWAEMIGIGGLVGCKNDSYGSNEGLPKADAEEFHTWQIHRLAGAGVDFLLAATLPAVPEAAGIALAMEKTGLPYFISFVIDRNGLVLDGTRLEDAFAEIDSICGRPPVGYMINCAYPAFLNPRRQPDPVLSRLVGYQANASSLDHSDLDGADNLQADDILDWGRLMVELNRKYGINVLGGCCGTGPQHLAYIVEHLKKHHT